MRIVSSSGTVFFRQPLSLFEHLLNSPPRLPRHAVGRQSQVGVCCAVLSYVIWGLFPLYWRMLEAVPVTILTAHRVVWSFGLLVLLAIFLPRLRNIASHLRDGRSLSITIAAAVMIALNWGAFMYAVNSDRVLQASLGYYINPLLSVLIGVVVLGEKLKPFQWLAVVSAAIGVLVMAVVGSGIPWIALTMAGAFGIYGLLKKKTRLPALEGLMLETGVLLPLAICYLLAEATGSDAESYSQATWSLLVFGGLVTITPLALFAVAAKRVTLSTIGILQYVAPTLQWFVGVVVFGESFQGTKLIGFAFVWAGVIVFIAGEFLTQTKEV